MNINIDKNLILNACLQSQKELIVNIERRLNTRNTDAISQNYSASQSEDRSAGKFEILNALKSEHTFAVKELEYLESLDPSIKNTHISPGAVVITDQFIFFIGISSEKTEIDGNEVIFISTRAPIYTSMEGLKKGDSFKYNETNYEIKEVY